MSGIQLQRFFTVLAKMTLTFPIRDITEMQVVFVTKLVAIVNHKFLTMADKAEQFTNYSQPDVTTEDNEKIQKTLAAHTYDITDSKNRLFLW